jgi:MtN3 and saliva related transmembrane protein
MAAKCRSAMDKDHVDALGLVAGCLTTAAFVPQVVRVWRTRSTRDISFAMFLLLTVGIGMWLIYGLFIESRPVVLANGVTLVLAMAILAAKIRYK